MWNIYPNDSNDYAHMQATLRRVDKHILLALNGLYYPWNIFQICMSRKGLYIYKTISNIPIILSALHLFYI